MSIVYKTIGVTEKNQALAAFVHAQETDHMHFSINLQRYILIRDSYEDRESAYYRNVVAEIPVLESRIREVENILQATYLQIDDAALAAATTNPPAE